MAPEDCPTISIESIPAPIDHPQEIMFLFFSGVFVGDEITHDLDRGVTHMNGGYD